jgi:CRISPR system Cascade subunit CasA
MQREWIPVTMLADGGHRDMSLREALLDSDEIRSIDGDIPLQRFSLTRLLIAVLYGVFAHDKPINVKLWREVLKNGPKDAKVAKVISDYCNQYSDRFDLFDDEVPFYQVANLHTPKNEVFGLERLALDVPSGEPFFTTRAGEGLESMSAAQAARWLVTLQAFDASGIKSGAVGDARVKGGKGYPIGTAWGGTLGGFLVEGESLWETLMLNLAGNQFLRVREPGVSWDDDKPVWERPQQTEQPVEGFNQEQEEAGNTAFFHGPATLMTWQSRRVRLFHEGERVTGILVCNGDRLKPQNAQSYEMMSGWRRSPSQEKILKKSLVYMPRKHTPARALWRGLPMLTAAEESETGDHVEDYLRPRILDWLTEVRQDDSTEFVRKMPIRLHAFGIEYGNNEAVVDSAIDDVLDVHLAVLTSTDPEMRSLLEEAVNLTDQGIGALRNMASDVARAAGLPADSPRGKIAESAYSAFDARFRQWVRTIDDDSDLDVLEQEWQGIAKHLLLRIASDYLAVAPIRAIVGREITSRDAEAGNTRRNFINAASAEKRLRGALNKIFAAVQSNDSNASNSDKSSVE